LPFIALLSCFGCLQSLLLADGQDGTRRPIAAEPTGPSPVVPANTRDCVGEVRL
jgi:hypothetical protein